MTREMMENTSSDKDRVEYVNCHQMAPDVIVNQPTAAQSPSNHTDAVKDPDAAPTKLDIDVSATHDDDARREKMDDEWGSTSTVYSVESDKARREGGGDGRGKGRGDWAKAGAQYSVEGETKSSWTTDLFFSIRGNRHKKASMQDVRRACHDCACVSCMMCSVARRLGDPRYLPFVPCTGPAVRFKVRIVRGITGSICNDCLVTSCCWPCAVCQMHREMDEM